MNPFQRMFSRSNASRGQSRPSGTLTRNLASLRSPTVFAVFFVFSLSDFPLSYSVGFCQPQNLYQGPTWSQVDRTQFYSIYEGSRLIPLSWLRVLHRPDGSNFLASIGKYGFLDNPDPDNVARLPIGFSLSPSGAGGTVGLTCSACHTRQINVGGSEYRIDGAPAIIDFAAFIIDLDISVGSVLASDQIFGAFADAVLGASATDQDARNKLHAEVQSWWFRFHTLIGRSLPKGIAWGPTRLDALSIIYNFIAGLDAGSPPTFVEPKNIQVADAPVRYPFLWNVFKQDHTQWTGIAEFGNKDLALARNLSEVYGVFAEFRPVDLKGALSALDRNYLLKNSACIDCFAKIDNLLRRLGPPVWRWPVDAVAAANGKLVFDRPANEGGCIECHGKKLGAARSPRNDTWATPIVDVGTDSRAWQVLLRRGGTGTFEGASIPGAVSPIGKTDLALNLLKASVAGTLIDTKAATALEHPVATLVLSAFSSSSKPGPALLPAPNKYEARVLDGVWAAAPYLHNGSVPTLDDLLRPPMQRPKIFAIGPNYDIAKVGLASAQARSTFILQTTGCEDRNSGNSNCGHDFGTNLSEDDRKVLIEYLKTL